MISKNDTFALAPLLNLPQNNTKAKRISINYEREQETGPVFVPISKTFTPTTNVKISLLLDKYERIAKIGKKINILNMKIKFFFRRRFLWNCF